MAATADHHRLGQAGLPIPPSNKGKPLTGVASQSYHVVSCRIVQCWGCHTPDLRTYQVTVMQASAWEQTAVLSAIQEQSIDLLAAECSQRPVPEHVSSVQAYWLSTGILCSRSQLVGTCSSRKTVVLHSQQRLAGKAHLKQLRSTSRMLCHIVLINSTNGTQNLKLPLLLKLKRNICNMQQNCRAG